MISFAYVVVVIRPY